MIKVIEPQDWHSFLGDFSERNRGRRARFEIYGRSGDFDEEVQEGTFQSLSIVDHTAKVVRTYEKHGREETMADHIENVRGLSVQYDSNKNEDVLEMINSNGDLTALHFESLIDGNS